MKTFVICPLSYAMPNSKRYASLDGMRARG
jgi:hypothetical protein